MARSALLQLCSPNPCTMPCLCLCHMQLQAWFILPPGESDLPNRARGFIKTILCKMPRNAAVAATGSSMCLVWSNVANMPPNGVALVAHNRTLTLPAVDAVGAEVAWAYLCTTRQSSGRAALPPDLYKLYSAPHPAMLTYLCNEYINSGAEKYAEDVSQMNGFVQVHERDKVIFEVRSLWALCCAVADVISSSVQWNTALTARQCLPLHKKHKSTCSCTQIACF